MLLGFALFSGGLCDTSGSVPGHYIGSCWLTQKEVPGCSEFWVSVQTKSVDHTTIVIKTQVYACKKLSQNYNPGREVWSPPPQFPGFLTNVDI